MRGEGSPTQTAESRPRRASFARASLCTVALATLIAVGCNGHGASDAHTPTPAPQRATFEQSACTAPRPAGQESQDMRCGTLTVPENRANSDGRTIQLAVAVLKSTSATPAPDPVLYLSGGPGGPNL